VKRVSSRRDKSCPYTNEAKAPLRKVGHEPTGSAALPGTQMESVPASARCRAVEAPPRPLDTRTKSKAIMRRTLPSESTWAAVHLRAGQFSAVLASGA
jgi:hypothetical protein